MLLQVWMAYLQGASSRNSRVNSVSSPHGTFSSTWISSWDSERWAYRLRPMDFKLICGLAAKCTYHNSASPGVFAVHWRPSLLAPKKYPLARLLKAHRPEKSSQTDISNFEVSSLSSWKTKLLQWKLFSNYENVFMNGMIMYEYWLAKNIPDHMLHFRIDPPRYICPNGIWARHSHHLQMVTKSTLACFSKTSHLHLFDIHKSQH